jgi:hypothetical protein
MLRSAVVVAGAWLSAVAASRALRPGPPGAAHSRINITGAKEISPQSIQDALRVRVGEPLADTPERIAEAVTRQYRDGGYAFARVRPAFEAASGVLALDIDEGVIGRVEFQGIDEKLARSFADEFALRAGDVFNSRRARQALDVLLRQTRGAISPGRPRAQTFADSGDLPRRRGAFDLVDRDGERILIVGLREPPGRFKIVPDLGEREDWFSSVDGFVPSLGMGIAVFDHDRFNHTFVAGHLSSDRLGTSRVCARIRAPAVRQDEAIVGGELHDLTASDDQWQVSSLEASLAASAHAAASATTIVGAASRSARRCACIRKSRRFSRGAVSGRNRCRRRHFSLWNGDDVLRPNAGARRTAERRSDRRVCRRPRLRPRIAQATYRRHQLDTLW